MKALVLIGGFGTRLRPLTYTVPKQLIPIAGKPMLYHALDALPAEVDEAILATGYKADMIAEYVRRHPYRIPLTTVSEAEPLGTGGAIRNAGDAMSDPFLLLNSDVIAHMDGAGLVAFHRRHGGVGTMTLVEVEDPEPYGVAAFAADDRIRTFVEKPKRAEAPSRWINAGVSVWNRSTIGRIPDRAPVSWEREVVPELLSEGVYGFRSTGFWEDAGTPERTLHAQRLLFDAQRGPASHLPSGTSGRGPVAIDATASVTGAKFGGYVTIDEGVTVAPGAYLEDSVVLAGAQIESGAAVSRSILGPNARIRAGHQVTGQVLAAGAEA
jgi:mannose-1-phosphate guanylyltransferase